MKRVVITRVGVVAPNGDGFDSFARGLKEGKSGLGEIDYFNAEQLPSRIVGQVKFFRREQLLADFPELRPVNDNKVFLGLHAFLEMMGSKNDSLCDCVINIGTSLESFCIDRLFAMSPYKFSMDTYLKQVMEYREKYAFLQVPLDFLGHFIKKRFSICGANYLNCSACAASTQAIGHSFQMIRDGRCRRVITGGFDSMLNPLGLGGFARLGALNTDNDLGEKAIRPFELRRKGTVLGEGAAFFLLEELETAKTNCSEILGEVIGYASSLDAYKLSEPDPHGRGIVTAMKKAVADAGIDSTEVDYINAHGTGTIANDKVETAAIKEVFQQRAYDIPVSSMKSMIGHLIGASGAVEIAGILAMMKHDFIAPTINLEKNDPECDLDYVPNISRKKKINVAVKNSLGFGGQNATLVIKRFE